MSLKSSIYGHFCLCLILSISNAPKANAQAEEINLCQLPSGTHVVYDSPTEQGQPLYTFEAIGDLPTNVAMSPSQAEAELERMADIQRRMDEDIALQGELTPSQKEAYEREFFGPDETGPFEVRVIGSMADENQIWHRITHVFPETDREIEIDGYVYMPDSACVSPEATEGDLPPAQEYDPNDNF